MTHISVCSVRIEGSVTHQTLEFTDEKTVENLSGLVTVANILESLGGILAGNVEHDLLTTAKSILVS